MSMADVKRKLGGFSYSGMMNLARLATKDRTLSARSWMQRAVTSSSPEGEDGDTCPLKVGLKDEILESNRRLWCFLAFS